jgi:Chloriridovirus ribonuclease III
MNNISKINLYCQKKHLMPPSYETLKKEGLDHKPNFQVSCTFERLVEFGVGPTLKAAKENAAEQIVELLDLDTKLKELDNKITFAIESYNAPLQAIWEGGCKQYTLTLKKKDGDEHEYKNLIVKIVDVD